MLWFKQASEMGSLKSVHTDFVLLKQRFCLHNFGGKSVGKHTIRRPGILWRDSMKLYYRETVSADRKWLELARNRGQRTYLLSTLSIALC